jgi:hypothetical protein
MTSFFDHAIPGSALHEPSATAPGALAPRSALRPLHGFGRLVPLGALLAAAVTVVPVGPLPVAHASRVITVTTTAQGVGVSGCSLQEAVLAANQDSSTVSYDPGYPNPRTTIDTGCEAGSGDDVILLGGSGYATADFRDVNNYLGPTATPIITSNIRIDGAGATLSRSSTQPVFRLFAVAETGSLDLRNVYAKGFLAQGGDGGERGGGGMGAGGAIAVHGGSLVVQGSTFEGNGAVGGDGGGSYTGPGAQAGGGGGGGGLRGHGSSGSLGGGGGGGARGSGGPPLAQTAAGGGGTLLDGGFTGSSTPESSAVGGYLCGGGGNVADASFSSADGQDGYCKGGGGGGGSDGIVLTGDGGSGAFGGGGGGGAVGNGDGGHGGFGGGGGGAGTDNASATDGGSGGDGGFGGGGGAGPGGSVFGGPGSGGSFAGDASGAAGGGGAGLGGAIFGYQAQITVTNSTFTSNYAARGVAGGTGAHNGADAGGAMFTVAGSLRVVNSTVSGNETTGDGAGIVVYKPDAEAASLVLENTIVAGNAGRDECFVVNGPSATGSNNLVTPHATDVRSGCPGITQVDDPQLGPLLLNAPGLTPTMALAPSSPSVDTGDTSLAPAADQRGVARPQRAGVDIGAFELDGPPPDNTPPVAAPTTSPAPNENGWNNTAVTVTWNWADEAGGSGLDAAACTTSSTSSGQGLAFTLSADCADLAGNLGHASTTADIDLTAPTVTCGSTPTFVIGSTPSSGVSATVADSLSGPAATSVGTPVTAADASTAGVKSASVTGTDLAGNSTTVSCPFVVAYGFLGFQSPIPKSSYQRGATIPVKFKLGNASGTAISDAAAGALLSPACLVRITLDGVDRGCAGYSTTSHSFQLDLKTTKSLARGTHTIGVQVSAADGSGLVNSETTTILVR